MSEALGGLLMEPHEAHYIAKGREARGFIRAACHNPGRPSWRESVGVAQEQEARRWAGLHVAARFQSLPPFVTASATGRFYFAGPTHLNSPGSGVAFRTTTSPFALIVSLNEPPPNHSGPCPSIGTNRPLLTHCRTSPFSSRIFD